MEPIFYLLHISLAIILLIAIAYYYQEATKAKEVGDLLQEAKLTKEKAISDHLNALKELNRISSEQECLKRMENYLITFLEDYNLFEQVLRKANPDIKEDVFYCLKDDVLYHSKLDYVFDRALARRFIREHLSKP